MTTDISHLGCSDFRVLYQGRINGEESAARIRTHKWERNLSEDPDVSRQQEGTNTSSFTSSTFIVNASNLLPCLLVCPQLQKEIQSIGLRKSSPPEELVGDRQTADERIKPRGFWLYGSLSPNGEPYSIFCSDSCNIITNFSRTYPHFLMTISS
jgi:hypothetical protein